MIIGLALLLEAIAIALCGRGGDRIDRSRVAAFLASAAVLGASARPLRGAYHDFGALHWVTLAVCAVLLLCEPPAEDERAVPLSPVFLASLAVASASSHWLPFVLSMSLLCVLITRSGAAAIGGFSLACLAGAGLLFAAATGRGSFSASANAETGASPALLVFSLALATAAALALWGGGLGWARRGMGQGAAPLRALTATSWGAVLVCAGPLSRGFSAAAWREASGGWQGAFALLGVIACVASCVRMVMALRRVSSPEDVARLLVVVQLAMAACFWGGVGGASQVGAVTGVAFALASFFVFRAAPEGVWPRTVAFAMLAGFPVTCVFWSRMAGLSAVARSGSPGLLVIVVATAALAMVLAVRSGLAHSRATHSCPPPGAHVKGGLRLAAVALIVASLLPSLVPSVATLPF